MMAETASEAAEWVQTIQQLKDSAIDASVLEDDGSREQKVLDELCEAFAVLGSTVDANLEKVIFSASGLEFLADCCSQLTKTSTAKLQVVFGTLALEPQSSSQFDIREKFRSPTDWADAISAIRKLDAVALPNVLADHLLNAIDTLYETFASEHGAEGKEAALGADDLLPIIV
jgi:hypothetical protein